MNFVALLLSGMSLCMKASVEIVKMPINMAVTRVFCSLFGTGVSDGIVFIFFLFLAFSACRVDRRGFGLSCGMLFSGL